MTQPEIDLGFNFDKWTADTDLTLVNVPWGNDYRDVVRKPTRADFDAWIDGQQTARANKVSRAKFNQNIVIDIPINTAMKYNYIRARNPLQPINNDTLRTYYYFIIGVESLNPRATRLVLQLDVWATYIYDVQLGQCFVDRGHVAIANVNQFEQYGRSHLTVPEGLDVGSEYRIVHGVHQRIIDIAGDADTDPGYDVLVCATLDLTQSPGTTDDPGIKASSGGTWQGLPTGADFYIFPTGYDLRTFMAKFSDTPWITQSIISITLIPNMKRYYPDYNYGDNISGDSSFKMYKASINGGSQPHYVPKSVSNAINWRNNSFIGHILGAKYAILKKFLTFPYMIIEMTAFNGSPIIIRPEAWQDPDARVTELAAFMPPGQRIVAYPERYNADAETLPASESQPEQISGYRDDFGEFINMAVTFDNFPSLPIVNNMAIAYLAQNAHGLAFSFQSAEWSRTRAQAGAQAGVDVANSQIGNTARQSGIANANAAQQAAISSNARMASGVVGAAGTMLGSSGLGPGQVSGAGQQIAQAGISASAELESTNASIGARGSSAVSDIQTAGQIRDTNQGFANYAAQGDYETATRGITAKMQDAMLTQPSVSGQFNGDAFNLINGMFGYTLKWKMPNLNALRQIGDYWLQFGYAVHQRLTPPTDLHAMSRYTYWKMTTTYIRSAPIPEGFKATIRGILERGTTVWKNPEDIGTAITDNAPLDGISY